MPRDLLKNLYKIYNHDVDIEEFIIEAEKIFPKLNCGLASVYLRYILGTGEVVRGKYNGNNHTFVKIGKSKILDITADQYGGPKIYMGNIKSPWSF